MQVDPMKPKLKPPMKPKLKPPGTKRLKLEHHGLLSNFGFKFIFRRCSEGVAAGETVPYVIALKTDASVGRCRLNL